MQHTRFIFIFLEISLYRYIFKDGVLKFCLQVHMRPKAHPVCLKAQRFVVIWVHTNTRKSLQLRKDVLGYFYL